MILVSGIVSTVVEQLGSILVEELKQSARLVVGADRNVRNLTATFKLIQAVLADAEEQQLEDKVTELWIDELQIKAYEMEDLLDEWSTAILKRQIEGSDSREEEQLSSLETRLLQISVFFSSVCDYLPTSCFSFREIPMRYDISRRIKDLNAELDFIAEGRNRYKEIVPTSQPQKKFVASRVTSHVLDAAVHGRDLEKSQILEFLMGGNIANLKIASIVGMGGLGKTTFAQLLHKEMKGHFDSSIWVCVSNSFDEFKVANEILESLSGEKPGSSSLSVILGKIEREVEKKKFFLVLDDVWEDSIDSWRSIMASLSSGLSGSRVLVTTRRNDVANALSMCIANNLLVGSNESSRTLELKELSMEACMAVFSQWAFFKWDEKECGRVKDIADMIVREKCHGSPLAARILGSFLSSKKSRPEWNKVLHSGIWGVEKLRTDLFAHMWLSYYDLSPQLRQCFSYCAIFPQDFVIRKDTLIKLWMAQGYLGSPSKEEDLELIGDMYFESLAARSFFQDIKKSSMVDNIVTCRMHDLVHDFAEFVSSDESYGNDVDVIKESKMDTFSKRLHHLRVVVSSNGQLHFPCSPDAFKSLRTLLVLRVNFFRVSNLPNDLANLPKCLRSLSLSNCGVKGLPPTISRLVQLRMLDLSHNFDLEELPNELCDLLNLQTLNVEHCLCLKRWPQWMEKLVSLRHLINVGGRGSIPRGIGRLTGLRTLSELRLGENGVTPSLRDLQNFNHLSGNLLISGLGESSEHAKDAEHAQLESKKHITNLSLAFKEDDLPSKQMIAEHQKMVEALKPSMNLEVLAIRHYLGKVSPSWLPLLINLTRLTLYDFTECLQLPPLWKLPYLEYLELDGFRGVDVDFFGRREIGSDKIVAFPSLVELKITSFKYWYQWEYTKEETTRYAEILPCLRNLYIGFCDDLEKLPDQLIQKPTLQTLKLTYCYHLCSLYQLGGEERHKVAHIPAVVIDKNECICGKALPFNELCDCSSFDYMMDGMSYD
ncbi:unnamed protein product [Linum trigynum]|uniref:Uncharacterized protein n=1 Tax=Linum trigynum TaxID=586398 RepID=A0AAV2FP87_9ROSI